MNTEVIVTCAVTGAGDTVDKNPAVPVTPQQIADAAIDAAKAGAAIAHIHVRDPETGSASRDPALYAAVVERVRASGTDVVLNLTAGMGGDFVPGLENPAIGGPGTDLIDADARVAHVVDLKPEICTLDCGSMNYPETVYINTPACMRRMAGLIREAGVKPELEVFDFGHVRLANQLYSEGLFADPPLYQLCLGIPWGAPADTQTMALMAQQLPPTAQWAAFGISRMQMPMAAQSVILGGHVRVGLEDNLYLDRGVLADNAQLVERATGLVRALGARTLTPAETRRKLGLTAGKGTGS